ncbi:hypothetical protein ABPG72_014643 [Tetrahymena utriculariae]
MQEASLNDTYQMPSSRYYKVERNIKKNQKEQFLQQLISTEQNFQVFKYQDNCQSDFKNSNTGQSFYKSHSTQFRGLVRVRPQNIQNSELLSKIYLLSQSVSNQKRNKQSIKQLRAQGEQNNIYKQNNYSDIDNLKNLNLTQNNSIYKLNIPNSYKYSTTNFNKLNSNIVGNNKKNNSNQQQAKLISQQALQDIENQYSLPKNRFFSSTEIQNQIFHLNNNAKNITRDFKDNKYEHQSNFQPPLTQRTEGEELPHTEIFKRSSNISSSLEARDNYENFMKKEFLVSKNNKNTQGIAINEIENHILEASEAQKDFNQIMKNLRYGKIQQHKLKIFREMKREDQNSKVFQFHQSEQENAQNQKTRYQSSKSPLSKVKSLRSSMETFYTTKQDNQELKNQQVSVQGDNILRKTILQKKQQQYKQDCFDKRFQNFFQRQATLDKILQPKIVTNQIGQNTTSKESLSQIQMISKQLNGKNPEIYNPFNQNYYKQKHIFSIKLEEQQKEDQQPNQGDCSLNKDILKETRQQNFSSSYFRQPSPNETLNVQVGFLNDELAEGGKQQQNNNQDISKILCKYINENRDFLSSEPDTKIKKTQSNINSPINLDSFKLLQKFLPNFNPVERHFAYNQNNLERNKLILEKVLLERIVKNKDESNTQQFDKQLNRKSEFLQQKISKNILLNKKKQLLLK